MRKITRLKVTYHEEKLSCPICSSKECYSFFIKQWQKGILNLQEQVYVLFLNGQSEVITYDLLNTGNCNGTLFNLKLAMGMAVVVQASKIVIAHSHPSGVLRPSAEDIAVTRKFRAAARLMDMELVDHLIVTKAGYFSFVDAGLFADVA